MMIDLAQLEALATVCPGARPLGEAGINYVFIPGLRVATGTTERTMDALLCPMQHGGYSTRLFLAEAVPERQRNWTTHQICNRAWHTWSWQNVPTTLTLLQILLAHLEALR